MAVYIDMNKNEVTDSMKIEEVFEVFFSRSKPSLIFGVSNNISVVKIITKSITNMTDL